MILLTSIELKQELEIDESSRVTLHNKRHETDKHLQLIINVRMFLLEGQPYIGSP